MENLVALSCESEATMLGLLLAGSIGFIGGVFLCVIANEEDK